MELSDLFDEVMNDEWSHHRYREHLAKIPPAIMIDAKDVDKIDIFAKHQMIYIKSEERRRKSLAHSHQLDLGLPLDFGHPFVLKYIAGIGYSKIHRLSLAGYSFDKAAMMAYKIYKTDEDLPHMMNVAIHLKNKAISLLTQELDTLLDSPNLHAPIAPDRIAYSIGYCYEKLGKWHEERGKASPVPNQADHFILAVTSYRAAADHFLRCIDIDNRSSLRQKALLRAKDSFHQALYVAQSFSLPKLLLAVQEDAYQAQIAIN